MGIISGKLVKTSRASEKACCKLWELHNERLCNKWPSDCRKILEALCSKESARWKSEAVLMVPGSGTEARDSWPGRATVKRVFNLYHNHGHHAKPTRTGNYRVQSIDKRSSKQMHYYWIGIGQFIEGTADWSRKTTLAEVKPRSNQSPSVGRLFKFHLPSTLGLVALAMPGTRLFNEALKDFRCTARHKFPLDGVAPTHI